MNTASVTGTSVDDPSESDTDSDPANVFCADPRIDIEKQVLDENGTWQNADTPPGPSFPVGSAIEYRFVVCNNVGGNVDLTNVQVEDSLLFLGLEPLANPDPGDPTPDILEIGECWTITSGEIPALSTGDGFCDQDNIENIATVHGDFTGTTPPTTVDDDDPANVSCRSGLCLVVIDEEGVDNDFWFLERAAEVIGGWTPGELINDENNPIHPGLTGIEVPTETANPLFPWNMLVADGAVPSGKPTDDDPGGDLVLFPTGQVDDEGWFNLPDEIHYVDGHASPHCGASSHTEWFEKFREGTIPQRCLDKIANVQPLDNQDLAQLVGETCIAVVYDSDISMNYEPIYANLQGARYGLFHFTVEALEVWGSIPENKSDSSSYGLWLRVEGIPPEGGAPLDFVEVRDHEPDQVEITRARCSSNTLTVTSESDFTPFNAPGASMTASVDGPDRGTNEEVVPFLVEEPMDYIGRGRWRLQYNMSQVPENCSNIRKRRLSTQTKDGGIYNDRVR
jgi:hypothetical protein